MVVGDACQLLRVGRAGFPSAAKAGSGLAHGSIVVVDKRRQPPGCLLEMTDLFYIKKLYYFSAQQIVNG